MYEFNENVAIRNVKNEKKGLLSPPIGGSFL